MISGNLAASWLRTAVWTAVRVSSLTSPDWAMAVMIAVLVPPASCVIICCRFSVSTSVAGGVQLRELCVGIGRGRLVGRRVGREREQRGGRG